MVGWPSEVNPARSVIPCTVESTDLILLAVSVSACRSLPYSLIEFSPLTPETASETLSCRYWHEGWAMRGLALRNSFSKRAVRRGLPCGAGQSVSGDLLKSRRRLDAARCRRPSSGRPCWDTTD